MKIAFYGSSLVSAYWNGAATYYRGILKALADLDYDITFFEPDVLDRQLHRDMEDPDWCRVVVYPGTRTGLIDAARQAADADIVIKASGVGFEDDALLDKVMLSANRGALKVFWDVDAPATLSELEAEPDHPLRCALPDLDVVLTYGGGDPVVARYRALGAEQCVPIYNALDPQTHFPVAPEPRFNSDAAFLGNRLPDREARADTFFFGAANRLADKSFLLGGAGWDDKALPDNISYLGHVGTEDHNAFYSSARTVLNISRDGMARNGFSPATRVFEAAGAAACVLTDYWEGIDMFFRPGREILIARDGADVADILRSLGDGQAERIGSAARTRVLAEHTYQSRAETAHTLLSIAIESKRVGVS